MASPLLIDFLTNEVLPKMILTFFVAHLQAGLLSLGIAEIDSVLLLNCQKYILLLFTFNFDNSHYIECVYTVPPSSSNCRAVYRNFANVGGGGGGGGANLGYGKKRGAETQ